MGDWGGQGNSPYTTVGELLIAKAMDHLAGECNSRFTVTLGDNFYKRGVDEDHMFRFNTTFENVFKGTHLQTPFYVIGGNKDHKGNVTVQVEYSKFNPRWKFPSLFYTFTEGVPGTSSTIQFVMIDTTVLVGNSDDTLLGTYPAGPKDNVAAQDHWKWIENTLTASTADYLIVAGHYPIWSMGEHGPNSILSRRLKPLMELTKVTAYLCGHDHNLQHIADESGIDYHVIGAGHLTEPCTDHIEDVPSDFLKFFWVDGVAGFAGVTVDEEKFVLTHYDQDGRVLYTAPPHGPRSKARSED